MKIIFHENQLSYRGTSLAVYDYAFYNQKILNNESVIVYNKNNPNNFEAAIEKFKNKFEVIGYSSVSELEFIVDKVKADLFYAIKYGIKDDIIVSNCKTAMHTVFKCFEPHGDVYAYVSEWLAKEMTNLEYPFVPHMVHLPIIEGDLRKELNIPKKAVVFGRHGGGETFDIEFVKKTIKKYATKNKEVYFLFLGTDSFVSKTFFRPYKNIIFLPATIDVSYKVRFINTCDAYIHARVQGESFGIAVGEFSIKNKPVITWSKSEERSHIEILKEKAILYENKEDLYNVFSNFTVDSSIDYDMYSKAFSPNTIMNKFKEVFLD
ncbi:hypothetical protein QVZ41_01130 [Wenyingzhuangia sp. chi5]|uniref:Uncharacterized protein n=1 Tax=Wenyingzhuangia gilva TaxID=3057677 RepID=A0ABT8VN91_9FLAO|nr:hypothetical protein [Wenyingzhuangia sp. chi5]MDO3693449.1 hypothetical protein [Wenyingzhuangia sp. chi5]